jgi:hypothetical protein
MLTTRYAKIVMSVVLASFCLLVAFDNITDYGTNYLFVQHVMSMDTTYPGNALIYRAITSPTLWHLAYAAIIAAEAIAGALFPRRWHAPVPGPLCASRSVQRGQGLRHRRVPTRVPHLGLRLHGGGRGMVRHVAMPRSPRSASS